MAFRAFGLTGGIGSGKSTVSGRFRARGLPVVDGDELARRVVAPGEPAWADIAEKFGPAVLGPDGSLLRARLGEIVFGDAQARAELEAIVHPRVRALGKRELLDLRARGEPLGCYVAPLLIEAGLAAELRPLVVITASETTQIARASARDGTSPQAVRARLLAQMPLGEKAEMADYLIDNEGPLTRTLEQADHVLDVICEMLDVDPQRYPKPPG